MYVCETGELCVLWSRGHSGHFRSSKANVQKVAVGDRIGHVNNSPTKRGDSTQSTTPPPSHQYGQQKKGRRCGVTCLAVDDPTESDFALYLTAAAPPQDLNLLLLLVSVSTTGVGSVGNPIMVCSRAECRARCRSTLVFHNMAFISVGCFRRVTEMHISAARDMVFCYMTLHLLLKILFVAMFGVFSL